MHQGSAGIEGTALAMVEGGGVARLLDDVWPLSCGTGVPPGGVPVFIPKPGTSERRRPLSIPTVPDRIVRAAAKRVFEPMSRLTCWTVRVPSHGSAHDAVAGADRWS